MDNAKHYFYVLHCADNTLYAGYTTDPNRRLKQHNTGTGAKYTRVAKRRPMTIVHLEVFSEKNSALKAEYAFKQLTKTKKLAYLKQNKHLSVLEII